VYRLCMKIPIEYLLFMIKWCQIKRSHQERLLSTILFYKVDAAMALGLGS
jgi:hypothetical protein